MGAGSRNKVGHDPRFSEAYDEIDWSDKPVAVQEPKVDPAAPLGTPLNPRKGYNIANKPFPRGWSWQLGQKVTTWDQYHRCNKELGLVDVGHPPDAPKDTSIPDGFKQARVMPND